MWRVVGINAGHMHIRGGHARGGGEAETHFLMAQGSFGSGSLLDYLGRYARHLVHNSEVIWPPFDRTLRRLRFEQR